MLIQSYMRKKIGFERKFSLSVGRVPDLPSPEQAPDLHQYFQYFGLCFGIFPYAALCTFRHFSSLLCTFHARLFRRAPRPVYTSTERVTYKEAPRNMRRLLITCIALMAPAW